MNFRPVVVKLTDVILHDDALLIQVIINVATAGVWDYISCGPVPIYSLTKNGGTMLLQQIAKDVDPEKLRIVIVLSSIEEHDTREVAALLSIPEGTVRSRLFLARKALAEKLQWLAKST